MYISNCMIQYICNNHHFSGNQFTIEDGLSGNKLALAYKDSRLCTETNGQLASILDQAERGNKIRNQFATSFPWQVCTCIRARILLCIYYFLLQLFVLSVRTMKNLIRNPMVSIVQVHVEHKLHNYKGLVNVPALSCRKL